MEAQISRVPAGDRESAAAWLAGDAEEVIVIDPGTDAGAVLAAVGDREVLAPGHTPGSVCLYCGELDALVCGDVLGAGGPVRHDGEFPDLPRQLSSIGGQVLTLPPATRILPGHGEETTVAAVEKRFDAWAAAGA
jgi:glyoxylase-like metal-dependent hydrolase (beta-lactamase superfamily II)